MKTLPRSYCAYEDSTTFLLRFVTIGHVFGQFLIVVEAASMCERGVKMYSNTKAANRAVSISYERTHQNDSKFRDHLLFSPVHEHCFCVVPRSIDIIPSSYPYKLPNRKRDLFILNAMYEGLATTGVLKRTTTMIFIL